MSELDTNNNKNCHCWIPVFGTLLIMIAFIDLGFGVVYGGIISEISAMREQLHSSSTSLKVAGFFRSITGGFVNLGNVGMGEAAKEVLSNFHHVERMAIFAWARMILSVYGIVIGFTLAFRWRLSPHFSLLFCVLSLGLAFAGLISSKDLYDFLSASGLTTVTAIIGFLSVMLHIVFPIVLSLKLLSARGKGFFAPSWGG